MATNPYSLQFNGSNQYARKQNATGVFGKSQFTVEGWFKFTSVPLGGSNDLVVSLGTRASPGEVYANLAVSPSSTVVGYMGINGSDHTLTGGTSLSTGTWYHSAVTYDGAYMRVFLGTASTADIQDNIVAKTGTMNTPGASYDSMFIGAGGITSESDIGDYLTGFVDEVRIWDVARTIEQLNAFKKRRLSGTETNLIGYYRMTEGSGSTLNDEGSANNDMTLFNTPTWSADVPFADYESSAGGGFIFNLL